MYCGPGDRVTFLVTGAESNGGCFIVEGLAAPGGGPPLHLRRSPSLVVRPRVKPWTVLIRQFY